MSDLTVRQREILGFIRDHCEVEGVPPTVREIAAHFRFSGPNAAMAHVQALRSKGYLTSLPGRARSLRVTDPHAEPEPKHPPVVAIPLYGSIPAGWPKEQVQGDEGCVLIDIETVGIKRSARTFALKVSGDSMVGRHIVDEDIAIIEHGVQPRSGDVVAALIDGQVTLKTFVVQRGKVYLRAENPKFGDLIPQEELQIQGVMVALVRARGKMTAAVA